MEKVVKNKNKSKRKSVIAFTMGAAIAVSSIAYSADTLVKTFNNDTIDLETLLNSYGYAFDEDMSYYDAGYLLGYDSSYYRTNYVVNTGDNSIPDVEVYNSLRNIYSGQYKDEYLLGLEHGIENGTDNAIIDYEKDNSDYEKGIARKLVFTKTS